MKQFITYATSKKKVVGLHSNADYTPICSCASLLPTSVPLYSSAPTKLYGGMMRCRIGVVVCVQNSPSIYSDFIIILTISLLGHSAANTHASSSLWPQPWFRPETARYRGSSCPRSGKAVVRHLYFFLAAASAFRASARGGWQVSYVIA